MKRTFAILALTFAFLLLLDALVAVLLTQAQDRGKLAGLVRYFEYGRSVPGKLARWEADPDLPGNLYRLAWLEPSLAESAERFAQEDPAAGPVVRSYGMSFVNNILKAAVAQDPGLIWDMHAGPGAPPNFTYAFFEADRENRRAGDVVVLGVLSSSVPAMAALSNRSWVFEQPAPFTYPVYRPAAGETGLVRTDPLVTSAEKQQALTGNSEAAEAWAAQMAAEDAFYGIAGFGAPWLDASPFARLVRRSLATKHVDRVEARILSGAEGYPYAEVLRRMIEAFARTARADGQVPVVMLIQTGDPRDANLLDIAAPVLTRDDIPYLATAEHADPRDPALFVADGHYRPDVDARFGQVFLEMLDALR